MNHSLRRADFETHIRIVVISLAAAIAVVTVAINARVDSKADQIGRAHV